MLLLTRLLYPSQFEIIRTVFVMIFCMRLNVINTTLDEGLERLQLFMNRFFLDDSPYRDSIIQCMATKYNSDLIQGKYITDGYFFNPYTYW